MNGGPLKDREIDHELSSTEDVRLSDSSLQIEIMLSVDYICLQDEKKQNIYDQLAELQNQLNGL